jgi:hypothetical protein
VNRHRHSRPRPRADHLQSALEASCATLVALESLQAGQSEAPAAGESGRAAIQLAIASLREAICEIRTAKAAHASPVSLGFVLGPASMPALAGGPGTDQTRPCRTA